MGMANSTGNPPESYPAEHFIGKPGCQCEPCRAWFDGWNAGYEAGKNDERAAANRAGGPHGLTTEHDADIAYYEREVRTARQGSLNPNEWPELEAEVVRVQDVRRVINALAANPDFRIPLSPAQLAMYDTSDEAGE